LLCEGLVVLQLDGQHKHLAGCNERLLRSLAAAEGLLPALAIAMGNNDSSTVEHAAMAVAKLTAASRGRASEADVVGAAVAAEGMLAALTAASRRGDAAAEYASTALANLSLHSGNCSGSA
jgi:hypothetical protein